MPQYSFLPFLQPFPIGTRILTGLLVALSLLNVLVTGLYSQSKPGQTTQQSDVPWLVLVPGRALPWYIWTFLTAGFVETKPLEFLLSFISLPLASRYLERVWGTKELLRFCAVVLVASNIIGFGLSWLEFFVLGKADMFLYGEPVRGTTGLLCGFLVAFTQLIPEHQVQLLGRLRMRVKHLPGIFLLASNVLTVVHTMFPWMLIQFGFIVAWWYLRFFQPHADGDFRGDRSETFAFVHWFPPPVRGVIGYVGNIVFNLAVKFKVVQPWDASPGAYSMLPGPGSGGSGGAATRAEAERRRALALKALDARVTSSPAAPAVAASSSAAPATSTIEADDKVKVDADAAPVDKAKD